MRTIPALFTATALGVCAVATVAQDVPTPPPAGVQPVPRKSRMAEPKVEVDEPKAAREPQQETPAAVTEPLPELPENPIRLEPEEPREAPPAKTEELSRPMVAGPMPQPPAEPKPPVKPVGPVYYYPPLVPEAWPGSAIVPPGPHIPNSPFVEDLSVSGDHGRYPYYSYRRPWYTPGRMNANVTIVW